MRLKSVSIAASLSKRTWNILPHQFKAIHPSNLFIPVAVYVSRFFPKLRSLFLPLLRSIRLIHAYQRLQCFPHRRQRSRLKGKRLYVQPHEQRLNITIIPNSTILDAFAFANGIELGVAGNHRGFSTLLRTSSFLSVCVREILMVASRL
ncbi:uncharacterized protein G2W53_044930 [Senna tora]|uniref:Uncharacterized protein n=1 Tax=Senna tora TaxID=362788 RepID=A0A834VWW4_9FABA|nr:uncharacterized protein G2W53_044930 [Senna tora]